MFGLLAVAAWPLDKLGAQEPGGGSAGADAATKETVYAGLSLRGIGPALMSGRVGDIAVDPTEAQHVVRRGGFRGRLEDDQLGYDLGADL